jgi:N-acetylneuraminate synthase
MKKIKIIAEAGINHNGSLEIAKQLIKHSKEAGCDYVKFQKRNPDVCVPENQKTKIRSTPWGEMTYLEYKWKIEFDFNDYQEIDRYCDGLGIKWFVSVWDHDSVDFMRQFENAKAYDKTLKIPSALINDIDLCQYARENCKTLIISTGMSTEGEIIACIDSCSPDVIMHTNSTYPCPVHELNLNYITWLKQKHSGKEIGYSGHEVGLSTTLATIPMGVEWIERHITMDKTSWGSDHSVSLEIPELIKLVDDIRDIEKALSLPIAPRELFGGELEKKTTLRK